MVGGMRVAILAILKSLGFLRFSSRILTSIQEVVFFLCAV